MILIAKFSSTFIMLAGIALLTAIMMRLTFRKIGKRKRRTTAKDLKFVRSEKPSDRWSGVQHDSEAQINKREVEFHERVREMSAQLDNKTSILQQLIIQSDQKIEELKRLTEEKK